MPPSPHHDPTRRSPRRFAARLGGALLAGLLAVAPAVAGDWPQWRGPSLDGRSPATELPLRWSAEEGIAWSLELPARGAATPIVHGSTVYLGVTRDPEVSEELELWAVDRETGAKRWVRPLGGGNQLLYKQHMASPSPVADADGVWVLTGTGVLARFTTEGDEVWRRDLQAEYGPFGLQWGYASSPLLVDGDLFVEVLHGMKTDEPSYLLRIDGASGETRWRVERPTRAIHESPDAYTTPMLLETGARREIVISGGDVVTGHDPADGKELWRVAGLNPENSKAGRVVASPLIVGDRIFAFGKRGPVLALQVPAQGPPAVVWTRGKGVDVPTPVSDGERIYLVDDGGIATALAVATGEVVWGPERLATGTYSASPILAAGRIYATSESGRTTVFRAGPRFEILATNDLGGYVLASPAVAGGRIFLRTSEALWAIDGEDEGTGEAGDRAPASAGR